MQQADVYLPTNAASARLIAELRGWQIPRADDVRWPFAALLTLYCVLGCTVLGFNRSPLQMLLIVVAGALLDAWLGLVIKGARIVPLSAWITCCSLAILLNYSHGSPILFLPVLLAIGSKYVLTFDGRHVFNPSMFGVAVSLLMGGEVITAAPAYQWAGASIGITLLLIAAALAFFVRRIGRIFLVVTFILLYAVQTGVRAYIMRWHLPPEMLFIGTLTTPPFFLFTFYMLTDPQTSPSGKRKQFAVACAIVGVDLALHLIESVYTFFYAALTVASARFLFMHAQRARAIGWRLYFSQAFGARQRRAVSAIAALSFAYGGILVATHNPLAPRMLPFSTVRVAASDAGLHTEMGDLLNQVDPRIKHIAKWILSIGDAVAVGDFDNDGRVDIFLTNMLKRPKDRAALYRNLGDLKFERVPLPAVVPFTNQFREYGVISGATFVDYDNDGDSDLALAVASGESRLLRNELKETGRATFVDVTHDAGLHAHTVSPAITFLDFDNDGDLDMLILNAANPYLPDYDPPRAFNAFQLPQPEYPSDRRMFRFMHNGWHDADNGGANLLYRNNGDGTFTALDSAAMGMPETHWSLAVVTADLNHDGWTDIYVANDFGPDDLYLNNAGHDFTRIAGSLFNEVGRDTYKGMNASVADFDRNDYLDIYVSNVHHSLQAEGSLLWMVRPSANSFIPTFSDEATQRGALNEDRFGWGAQAGDINNDGWPDIIQANGMVDDRLDPKFDRPSDYLYVNHKLMQSSPEIHTYADMWGDIRGRTLFGNEKRRAYLNRGAIAPGEFVDVAGPLGLDDPDNSRGVLLSDFDNDGDLDVLITNQHGEVSLYRNTLRQSATEKSNYLDLILVGDGSRTNRNAVGTVVTVSYDVDGKLFGQMDEVTLLGGFSSQHDPRLHFGLGSHLGPVTVRIRWHNGDEETRTLEINQLHVVKQAPR